MPLHNAGYQHWEGEHLGIWHRRATIAMNGLRGCLQNKWMRYLLAACWSGALVQVAILFLVGQLLVKDSLIVRWIGNLGPELQTFARSLTAWLEQHPEISVRCSQNMLFYFFATNLIGLSFIAVAMTIPHLISRDLSSRAIIIYSSKAVSRLDYLVGKLGAILGILFLTWLGPLLAAWFTGNLLAPRWHFFWHAKAALGNLLVYGTMTMLVLSAIALGISAISSRERIAVSIWLVIWLVGRPFAEMAEHNRSWLKHLSVSFDFQQVAMAVFRLGDDLKLAQENIPVLGQMLHGIRPHTMERLQHPALGGAMMAFGVLLVLAVWVLSRRVKPE
jgi:ABC-type transport system involved in multi-copper enzyme maturation permease subunit